MQEIKNDGTEGEVKTADTLEELLPEIKKSLAKPDVRCVKVFNALAGKGVTVKEQSKSFMEAFSSVDAAREEEK